VIVRELLSPVHFRASVFSRFSEKIAAINSSSEVDWSRPGVLGDFSRQLTPDAFLGDAARIGVGRLQPLVKMNADLSPAYISELTAFVNDRTAIDACNANYEYESDFDNLFDAAGTSTSGSNQTLAVGADQFNGLPLDLNLSQRVTYQVVRESSNRFQATGEFIKTCIFNQVSLYEDIISEGIDLGLTYEEFVRDILGNEVADFNDLVFPEPPPSVTYKIKVSYVLPDGTLTSNGTISLRR
jgi:hypothetical protein